MKPSCLILSALAVALFVSGCETVPETSQKTARQAATDQGTTAAREGSAKLGGDAAASATSKAK